MYKAIKGIYENGELTLLEPAPDVEKSEVLVTFLNDTKNKHKGKKRIPGSLQKLGKLEGKTYSIPDDFNEPIEELKDYM